MGVVDCVLPLLDAKTSKVTTLRLADTGVNQDAAKRLAAKMPKSTLRTLDLSVNPLSGAGDTLGELLDGPLMDEIMFKGCALTPEDMGAIAEQLPFTGIKSLQLAGNHFGRGVGQAAIPSGEARGQPHTRRGDQEVREHLAVHDLATSSAARNSANACGMPRRASCLPMPTLLCLMRHAYKK